MDLCRHCGMRAVNRARKLCWVCYQTPEVRELYPCTSMFARRGLDNAGRRRRPPAPTQALPGTPEKIAVLRERASMGLELWHPADALLSRRRLRKQAG
jgi:hypothetical protein